MIDKTLDRLQQLLSSKVPTSMISEKTRPASVLVIIYQKDGGYCIQLQKRSKLVQNHKGEISFPGGTPENHDSTSLATALRETYEEVGILSKDISILGQMDDVLTQTGYLLKVFVGTITYPYKFLPSKSEVEEILEVPIGELENPLNWREEVRLIGQDLIKSYSYAYKSHLIYGATAKIITQFLQLIEQTSPHKEALCNSP
ncbi:MAG: coenzyme A pyrophosphatase [Dehalococcoidia bacterium]|nr:coenzyme A pyrophosphatase [Dehalococcoidia bacterium]